jgi:uncharacterized membrane protein YhaH (DUF805 family)
MRGRMNRATYWLCLTVILAIVAVMSLFGIRPPRIGEAMLILMCTPRLHDLGRSGWWVLVPLGIELVAIIGAIALVPAEDAQVVFGAALLVVVGFIVLLGLIPGDAQANRFGDPPKSPFAFQERAKVVRTEEIFK